MKAYGYTYDKISYSILLFSKVILKKAEALKLTSKPHRIAYNGTDIHLKLLKNICTITYSLAKLKLTSRRRRNPVCPIHAFMHVLFEKRTVARNIFLELFRRLFFGNRKDIMVS